MEFVRQRVPVTENDIFMTLRGLINRGYCDPKGVSARAKIPQEVVDECLRLATEKKMCLEHRFPCGYILTPYGQEVVEMDSLRRIAQLSREGLAPLWE